jgi:hypothetical protein
LAALLAHGRVLRDRVDETEREQRETNLRVAAASAALADVERRSLAGDDVDAQRTKLELGLAKAKAAAAEPWPERHAGAQQAVRGLEREVARFVSAHFAELYGELAEDAESAASRVDRACSELIAAYHERQLVEGRVIGLAAMVGHAQPGDVARTRAEAAAGAASSLLSSGGERAPLLADDPRPPREKPSVNEAMRPEPAAT